MALCWQQHSIITNLSENLLFGAIASQFLARLQHWGCHGLVDRKVACGAASPVTFSKSFLTPADGLFQPPECFFYSYITCLPHFIHKIKASLSDGGSDMPLSVNTMLLPTHRPDLSPVYLLWIGNKTPTAYSESILGKSGDVYIDTTELKLFAKLGSEWRQWLGPNALHSEFVSHPFESGLILWCDGEMAGWTDKVERPSGE
jgi:hypothetical protein